MRIYRRSPLTPGAPAPGNAFDLSVARETVVAPGSGTVEIELDLLARIADDQVLLLLPRPELIAAGLTPSLTLSVIRAQDPIGRPRLSVARPDVEVRLSPGVPYARLLVLSAPLERFYYDPTLLDEIGPESLEMSEDPIEPTPDQI